MLTTSSGKPDARRDRAPTLGDLSVIVPVGPGDEAWRGLAEQLRSLADAAEVVWVGTGPRPPGPLPGRWMEAPRGRARQMNAGAAVATRPFLWFLHADSRLAADTLPALEAALQAEPGALHFFDLRFLDDGPALMRLNEVGARLRSRRGGMPFGDQGFCLRRDVWERLGPFRVDVPYGEDHLLAWQARRHGVRLRPTGGVLLTSARRYRERGWLRTTLRHLYLTARQALPEWIRLVRG